jgi:hypothetical protein
MQAEAVACQELWQDRALPAVVDVLACCACCVLAAVLGEAAGQQQRQQRADNHKWDEDGCCQGTLREAARGTRAA